MTLRKTVVVALVVAGIFCFAGSGKALAAWGDKELETEKTAVTFEREVARGSYKVVTTGELKGWIDQKKEMLIVDTMPARQLQERAYTGGRQLSPAYSRNERDGR